MSRNELMVDISWEELKQEEAQAISPDLYRQVEKLKHPLLIAPESKNNH